MKLLLLTLTTLVLINCELTQVEEVDIHVTLEMDTLTIDSVFVDSSKLDIEDIIKKVIK